MAVSVPRYTLDDGWHLPYVAKEQLELDLAIKTSVACCARVSYLTHEQMKSDEENVRLHDSLLAQGHMSPLEHQARPANQQDLFRVSSAFVAGDTAQLFFGPLKGWVQYRKLIPNEADMPV
jgi:hypothetical protein